MKAAVIGAGTQALQIIKKAQRLGMEVVALDKSPDAAGMQAADESLVVDVCDEKEVLKVLEETKPDFIIPGAEGGALVSVGAANDALGLKGISRNAASLCTDKAGLLKKLAEKGLGDPIREKVFAGVVYGADGVMDGAAFSLVLLRKKVASSSAGKAAGFFSVQDLLPADQQLQDRVAGYLTQAAALLGLKNCLIHADLIVTRHRIYMIDLSVSLLENVIYDVFIPAATGIDMTENYLRSQAGLPYSYHPVKTGRILMHYFDLPAGTVTRVPEPDMVKWFCEEKCAGVSLKKWDCRIRTGDRIEANAEERTIVNRGYFILSGDSEDVMTIAADGIGMFFRVEDSGKYDVVAPQQHTPAPVS